MLNDRPWYWRFQDQNGWSPLAVQNRPADEDPGRPGATNTNGRGIALQRYTGPGNAPLLKQEKLWQPLFPTPWIVGEGRPDYSPENWASQKEFPAFPPRLCFVVPLSPRKIEKVAKPPGKPATTPIKQKKVLGTGTYPRNLPHPRRFY